MKLCAMMDNNIPVINQLDLASFPKGRLSRAWLHLTDNGIGQPVMVPIMVARGKTDGPVLGITAVVHGNELNGLKVVQKLFQELPVAELAGTIIAAPIVNVPSALMQQRRFIDNQDLNRRFPGREDGNRSELYAHHIVDRILVHFTHHIDLHTASFGRVNSYYVRANMKDETTKRLALLQNADIIVDTEGHDGTLRSVAESMGIASLTVEVGDPNKFQKGVIRSSMMGIYNVLAQLDMIDQAIEENDHEAIYCKTSSWLYTDRGGILEVYPSVASMVEKGDLLARIYNAFGDCLHEYYAPYLAVVVGKAVHPVCPSGGRIIHLGIPL